MLKIFNRVLSGNPVYVLYRLFVFQVLSWADLRCHHRIELDPSEDD